MSLELTVPPDVKAEGGLHVADVVADTDVQTVDSSRGEGVVQLQAVFIQHGQRAAHRHVGLTVRQETPAHPHRRTKDTKQKRTVGQVKYI